MYVYIYVYVYIYIYIYIYISHYNGFVANHALGHMMYIAGRAHCLHVYHTHLASVGPEESACRESRCYIYIIMKTMFPPLGYHTMDVYIYIYIYI